MRMTNNFLPVDLIQNGILSTSHLKRLIINQISLDKAAAYSRLNKSCLPWIINLWVQGFTHLMNIEFMWTIKLPKNSLIGSSENLHQSSRLFRIKLTAHENCTLLCLLIANIDVAINVSELMASDTELINFLLYNRFDMFLCFSSFRGWCHFLLVKSDY